MIVAVKAWARKDRAMIEPRSCEHRSGQQPNLQIRDFLHALQSIFGRNLGGHDREGFPIHCGWPECFDDLVRVERIGIELPLAERDPIATADPGLRQLNFVLQQMIPGRFQGMFDTILLAPRFIFQAASHGTRLG